MSKFEFELWLSLHGSHYIKPLFCKPINQDKPRWRRVRKLLEAQHD